MDNARVRDAFAHLTRFKDEHIVCEGGRAVSVPEAVRRYRADGDDRWVLHVLMGNLGYFANALGKVAAKWNIDPADYIPFVYEGLREAMGRADPDRVRLSYLSTGVFMYCRRLAEKEVRERSKEAKMDEVIIENDEGEELADLDMILAANGIYEVPLSDETAHEACDALY